MAIFNSYVSLPEGIDHVKWPPNGWYSASEGKSFVASLHFAQDLDDPAICERFSRSASWEELYFIELSKDFLNPVASAKHVSNCPIIYYILYIYM